MGLFREYSRRDGGGQTGAPTCAWRRQLDAHASNAYAPERHLSSARRGRSRLSSASGKEVWTCAPDGVARLQRSPAAGLVGSEDTSSTGSTADRHGRGVRNGIGTHRMPRWQAARVLRRAEDTLRLSPPKGARFESRSRRAINSRRWPRTVRLHSDIDGATQASRAHRQELWPPASAARSIHANRGARGEYPPPIPAGLCARERLSSSVAGAAGGRRRIVHAQRYAMGTMFEIGASLRRARGGAGD